MGSQLHLVTQLIAGAAIAMWSHAASAGDPTVADLLKRGGDAYKAGHYDDAAADLQKAYDREPNTNTLFGLAQAERLGGHCAAAMVHYRKLLEQLTDLNTAKLVEGNVTLCEKAEPSAKPPEPKPLAPPPATPPPVAPTTTIVRVEHRTDRLAIALFATGTLSLGASVGLYVAGGASLDDAKHARTLDDSHRLNDRGDLERGLSYVALGAGAGMLGYAIFRWVRGTEEHPPATVSVIPVAGGSGVSVLARW